MATHELVVPKSIPITSPASVDAHLVSKLEGDAENFEEERTEASPLRTLSCKAIVLTVRLLDLVGVNWSFFNGRRERSLCVWLRIWSDPRRRSLKSEVAKVLAGTRARDRDVGL